MQANRDKSKSVHDAIQEKAYTKDTAKTAVAVLVAVFLKLWWLWLMVAAVLVVKALARKR